MIVPFSRFIKSTRKPDETPCRENSSAAEKSRRRHAVQLLTAHPPILSVGRPASFKPHGNGGGSGDGK